MSDTAAVIYRIASNVHVNEWVNELQETVSGHRIKAYWYPSKSVVSIFIPDTDYSAENVDTLIRAEGAKASAVAALGS